MCKGVILGKNKVRNDLWLSEHVYIHTITRKNELSFTYLLANLFLIIKRQKRQNNHNNNNKTKQTKLSKTKENMTRYVASDLT